VLQARKIEPRLPLEQDLQLTDQTMSYDGTANRRASVTIEANPLHDRAVVNGEQSKKDSSPKNSADWPKHVNGAPDFEKMNPLQRRAYDQERLSRKFG
jgi:hypothetical protein